MPTEKSTPSSDEPLETLQACHRRIEAHLRALERLASEPERPAADAEGRAAARLVLDFFDTAAALHQQDEDGDFFPLLRECAAERGRVEIAALIDEIEREHESMEALWRRVRAGLSRFGEGGGLLDGEEVLRFAWLYRRHMDTESAALLPFAKEALDPSARSALGDRMARRRRDAGTRR